MDPGGGQLSDQPKTYMPVAVSDEQIPSASNDGTPDRVAGAADAGSLPSLSLTKGGGAIRGIGEKFSANPVTGTGTMTIPVNASPGRSGFGPELTLTYNSGSGNSPFGFGWSLSEADQAVPSLKPRVAAVRDDLEHDPRSTHA
jgi:hypothetical protein